MHKSTSMVFSLQVSVLYSSLYCKHFLTKIKKMQCATFPDLPSAIYTGWFINNVQINLY